MLELRKLGILRTVMALIINVHFGSSVFAQPSNIAGICDSAASLVSRETGVPLDVLLAITRTETGRSSVSGLSPWPWTVNMEGVGKWFDDVASAQAYVGRHFARGARSFDVGCFQINYKWHGQAFGSIEEMFDPILNARYAARFLSDLYTEFGNWSRAAAAYHSRTPKYARRYMARFDRIRADLPDIMEPAPLAPSEAKPVIVEKAPPRANSYPFLVAAQRASGASLVPLGNALRSPIDASGRNSILGLR
ncbi:MAG: lytic transglycosylase domain-containing protein [Paracoccaceae bacterium]